MKTGSYLVYDQESRYLGRCSDDMDYIFQMGSRQAKILELVPEEKIITILGMTDKFIAGAGVENTRIFQNICSVKVNCGGTFSFVSRQEADQVYFEGRNIPYTRESDVYTVKVKDEGGVIDIILCGADLA